MRGPWRDNPVCRARSGSGLPMVPSRTGVEPDLEYANAGAGGERFPVCQPPTSEPPTRTSEVLLPAGRGTFLGPFRVGQANGDEAIEGY
jgi:hypothetical protein